MQVADTEFEPIKGRDAIRAAYCDEALVADYIVSRYSGDPFGREVHNRQAALVRWIVRQSRVERLLEVACGPARLTVHAPRVPYACAIEQSPAMLREAEKRLKSHGL